MTGCIVAIRPYDERYLFAEHSPSRQPLNDRRLITKSRVGRLVRVGLEARAGNSNFSLLSLFSTLLVCTMICAKAVDYSLWIIRWPEPDFFLWRSGQVAKLTHLQQRSS